MDIIQELKEKILPGTVIPKPLNRAEFYVKRWGVRRNEEALIYTIPNHKDPSKPYEKGVTISEWEKAYAHILGGGCFDRAWFNEHLPLSAKQDPCNFTTIGGIFQLLNLVDYERGIYKLRQMLP